jgi:hypothetical protein
VWTKITTDMKRLLGIKPEFEDIKKFFEEQFMKIFNTESDKILKELKITDKTNNVLSNVQLIYRILFLLNNFLAKEGALNLSMMMEEISKTYKQNTPANNMIEFVVQEAKRQIIVKMDGYDEKGVSESLKILEEKLKLNKGEGLTKLLDDFFAKYFKNIKTILIGQFGAQYSNAFTDKSIANVVKLIKDTIKPRVTDAFKLVEEKNLDAWLEKNKKGPVEKFNLEEVAKSYGIEDGKNLQKLIDDKTEITYKRDSYDNNKKSNEQAEDATAKGVIIKIDKKGTDFSENDDIVIKNSKTNEEIQGKKVEDILPKIGDSDEAQKELTTSLKKIKDTKKENIPRVGDLVKKFSQDEENIKKAQDALKPK